MRVRNEFSAVATLPNLHRSESDLARTRHADVRHKSSRELYLEQLQLQRGLAIGVFKNAIVPVTDSRGFVPAEDWAIERIATIAAELRRRQKAGAR